MVLSFSFWYSPYQNSLNIVNNMFINNFFKTLIKNNSFLISTFYIPTLDLFFFIVSTLLITFVSILGPIVLNNNNNLFK